MTPKLLGALVALVVAAAAHAQRIDTVVSTNLSGPYGVANDGSSLYILDSGNNRVQMLTPEGVLSSIAGRSGYSGAKDGLGLNARFNDPRGIVYSAAWGGLIVADSGNNAIRFVAPTTLSVTTIGGASHTSGWVDGAPATSQFSYPTGVDVDPATGVIYIADSGNGMIRTIDTNRNASTYIDFSTNAPSGTGAPTAVAIGNPGVLWVADAWNHVIWMVVTNTGSVSVTRVTGQFGRSGTNDSVFAEEGLLGAASSYGLLWRSWLGADADLIISDSGNNTLRRLYTNRAPDVLSWSLATFSGSPGQAGSADGLTASATFKQPAGLCAQASSSGFYVADSGNNSIRIFTEATAPKTRLADPQVGYLIITTNASTGDRSVSFQDVTGNSVVLHNIPAEIAAQQTDGAEVHFTYGPPPVSTVTNPASSDPTFTLFTTQPAEALPRGPFYEPANTNIVLKAIAEKSDGSIPSSVVNATFIYKAASPVVAGVNAANLAVSCETLGSTLYYTIDGSEPTATATSVGAATLSIAISQDTTLKVKAFRNNFQPSATTSVKLLLTNYMANSLVWGLASGEGSSAFKAWPGQSYYAPVALLRLPGQSIYSFQFDAWFLRTNTTPKPVTERFTPLILDLVSNSPPVYTNINCNYSYSNFSDSYYLVNYTDLSGTARTMFTGDLSSVPGTVTATYYADWLSFGWITLLGNTNLYDTLHQDLVQYWSAHETVHSGEDSIVMGAMKVRIPLSAATGTYCQLELLNASGTDGINNPVAMQAITNGSTGAGSVNSVKIITVGDPAAPTKYLVGSLLPVQWYNAGEFGSNTLQNSDVIQTLLGTLKAWPIFGTNIAVGPGMTNYLGTNAPPDSDLYDAMDSANSATLQSDWMNLPAAEIASINATTLGDGVLDLNDVYVTFRRSTDPTLKWYKRYWAADGTRHVEETPNVLSKPSNFVASVKMEPLAAVKAQALVSGAHSLRVRPGVFQGGAGQTIEVPITVEAQGDAPVRTMLIDAQVIPLEGAPALTGAIGFSETDSLSTGSKFTVPVAANEFGGAWLDSQVEGVSGTNVIGSFSVPIPANAGPNAAYLLRFKKFSASPNGLALFPVTVENTLITLSDRSQSSWNDGIPDSWRLLYFGTVSNLLSSAASDADGDGYSNYQEYLAGTSPTDASVFPELPAPTAPTLGLLPAGGSSSAFTLQWATETGRHYFVETSWDLFSTNWSTIWTNAGDGGVASFTDTNAAGSAKFYRVRAQ